MKSSELRTKYLNFFKKQGHKIIPSASLVPENDPTVLFTTAGMHPLVPYLLGQKHPEGKRLTSAQKCIRTGDIDDVGDDTHLTFFEMLGNWSLGDYWKKEAIKWSFEFLTKELKIPLERLAVSCFAGDQDAPRDTESAEIWKSLGIKEERISFLGKDDNWWGPAGLTGPCGPDTEMFYWKLNNKKAPKVFDAKDKNWVEIWNDVFMQYVKDLPAQAGEKGNYNTAIQKNVDTGMGLERTCAILNGKENVFETDLFLPIIEKIGELAKEKYEGKYIKAYRIIADHVKAAVMLIGDDKGLTPSNKDRGYVLRKIIRRAVRYSDMIKMKHGGLATESVLDEVVDVIIHMYKDAYPEIYKKREMIIQEILKEEVQFRITLQKGLHEFENIRGVDVISGKEAFNLYQTYGFPIEMTGELARDKGLKVDLDEFNKELKNHQDLSRTASAGVFKGGLADASEQTTKLHTAAHLMLAGLRKVLGVGVYQKGSNITAERLRFDFSHKDKMTSEQIKDVENFVNGIIKEDLPVSLEEMTLEKAKELGAMGVFESKYGEKVKVYTVGEGNNIASREICGGPHVERTGKMGHFKIQKEESSSSGIRRIKAILE
ncbi:MAG: alanine--tRNA ligase [Candidatus Staskawiczbacteria bacterium]|nr:alanine--tRNA ligase [Candidatus Staskawiczbacteria bacterium]